MAGPFLSRKAKNGKEGHVFEFNKSYHSAGFGVFAERLIFGKRKT
jgi:hypothetical protein